MLQATPRTAKLRVSRLSDLHQPLHAGDKMIGETIRKSVMDSIGVVVGNIIPNQAAQMRLTKRDNVIKQLSAAAANPAKLLAQAMIS